MSFTLEPIAAGAAFEMTFKMSCSQFSTLSIANYHNQSMIQWFPFKSMQ